MNLGWGRHLLFVPSYCFSRITEPRIEPAHSGSWEHLIPTSREMFFLRGFRAMPQVQRESAI